MKASQTCQLTRRAAICSGTLMIAAARQQFCSAEPAKADGKPVRMGLVTDLHYADKPDAGSRHYRETLSKLEAAAAQFSTDSPQHLIELGDFIDSAPNVKQELQHLKRINRDFAAICPNRHYVLGNHCVHTLHKQEFLDTIERKRSFYSFDAGQVHCIILDACFRSDGQPYGRQNFEWTDPNLSAAELEWLEMDLKQNPRPTLVFVHQRLDVDNHYGIKNAAAVRRLLEAHGKTLAVFQGHSHQNEVQEINGIHYCTLVAMVEGSAPQNNGFSVLTVDGDLNLNLKGFVRQKSYRWGSA